MIAHQCAGCCECWGPVRGPADTTPLIGWLSEPGPLQFTGVFGEGAFASVDEYAAYLATGTASVLNTGSIDYFGENWEEGA